MRSAQPVVEWADGLCTHSLNVSYPVQIHSKSQMSSILTPSEPKTDDQRYGLLHQCANPFRGFVPHNPGMKQTNNKAYQPLRVFRLESSNLDSSVNIHASHTTRDYPKVLPLSSPRIVINRCRLCSMVHSVRPRGTTSHKPSPEGQTDYYTGMCKCIAGRMLKIPNPN